MANARLVLSGPASTTAATTQYATPANGFISLDTTEANKQTPYRTGGTLAKLFVRIITNATTASSTVTVRKNTADGSGTVTIGSGATGTFEDTTNTDSITAGDNVAYKVITGSGGAMSMGIIAANFVASADTMSKMFVSGFSTSTASLTRFLPIAGSGLDASEVEAELRMRTAGTLQKLAVYISVNGRGTATTFRSRLDGVDGGLSVSLTAGGTGIFEDTAGSGSISVDNDMNLQLVTGTGGGTITSTLITTEFLTTNNKFIVANQRISDFTVNFNSTIYFGMSGSLNANSTTESDLQVPSAITEDLTVSDGVCYVLTNTIATSASTIKYRDNGADGNISISIAAGATGLFTDTVNTDTATTTDQMVFNITTPNTSGSLILKTVGFTYLVNVAAGAATHPGWYSSHGGWF